MALSLQVLYAKNLAASSTTTVTPTTVDTKGVLVKNIMLTNVGAAAVTVDVKLIQGNNNGGTANSYVWCAPKSLSIPVGGQVVLDNEFTLNLNYTAGGSPAGAPDSIEVIVGSGSSVDCVVNGLKRDV
jgi:hypothetical protein